MPALSGQAQAQVLERTSLGPKHCFKPVPNVRSSCITHARRLANVGATSAQDAVLVSGSAEQLVPLVDLTVLDHGSNVSTGSLPTECQLNGISEAAMSETSGAAGAAGRPGVRPRVRYQPAVLGERLPDSSPQVFEDFQPATNGYSTGSHIDGASDSATGSRMLVPKRGSLARSKVQPTGQQATQPARAGAAGQHKAVSISVGPFSAVASSSGAVAGLTRSADDANVGRVATQRGLSLHEQPLQHQQHLRGLEQQHVPSSSPTCSYSPSDLTNRLKACSNWYEMRALLAACSSQLQKQDVASALWRLSSVIQYSMQPQERIVFAEFLNGTLLTGPIAEGALPQMSPAQLTYAVHSLAHLGHVPPPSWLSIWASCVLNKALKFHPKHFSLLVWSLSKLPRGSISLPQQTLSHLLAVLLQNAQQRMVHFNAQDLSNTALALAQLRYVPEQAWQDVFLQQAVVQLPRCSPQALANLAHGLAHGGWQLPDTFLQALCRASEPQLQHSTPHALAALLGACDAAGYTPPAAWQQAFFAAAQASLRKANALDLTHMLASMHRLGLSPPRAWVQEVLSALADHAHDMPGPQLVFSLHAMARVGISGGSMPGSRQPGDQLQSDASADLDNASSDEGSSSSTSSENTAGSSRVAGSASSSSSSASSAGRRTCGLAASTAQKWLDLLHARMDGLDLSHLNMACWALATLGIRPSPAWMRTLLGQVRACLRTRSAAAAAASAAQQQPGDGPSGPYYPHHHDQQPQLSASHLCTLLWSLAGMRYSPTWPWVQEVLEVVRLDAASGSLSGQDYALIFKALLVLGMRLPHGWMCWGAALMAVQDAAPRTLAQMGWGLVRLRQVPPPAWRDAYCDALMDAMQREHGGCSSRRSVSAQCAAMSLWVLARWQRMPSKAAAAAAAVVSYGVPQDEPGAAWQAPAGLVGRLVSQLESQLPQADAQSITMALWSLRMLSRPVYAAAAPPPPQLQQQTHARPLIAAPAALAPASLPASFTDAAFAASLPHLATYSAAGLASLITSLKQLRARAPLDWSQAFTQAAAAALPQMPLQAQMHMAVSMAAVCEAAAVQPVCEALGASLLVQVAQRACAARSEAVKARLLRQLHQRWKERLSRRRLVMRSIRAARHARQQQQQQQQAADTEGVQNRLFGTTASGSSRRRRAMHTAAIRVHSNAGSNASDSRAAVANDSAVPAADATGAQQQQQARQVLTQARRRLLRKAVEQAMHARMLNAHRATQLAAAVACCGLPSSAAAYAAALLSKYDQQQTTTAEAGAVDFATKLQDVLSRAEPLPYQAFIASSSPSPPASSDAAAFSGSLRSGRAVKCAGQALLWFAHESRLVWGRMSARQQEHLAAAWRKVLPPGSEGADADAAVIRALLPQGMRL